MLKHILFVGLLVSLPACEGRNHPNEAAGVVTGAAVGAGAGAVIGHQSGHTGGGAAIGGVAGAVAGGLTGAAIDKSEESKEKPDPTIVRQQKEMQQLNREEDDADLQQYRDERLREYLDTHN